MKITHINLARGFRGGERQTQLLIEALADKTGPQNLICPKDAELSRRIQHNDISVENLTRPYLFHLNRCKNSQILHAHEAKAAHFAFLAHKLYSIPYIITRRVPNIPKANTFTHKVYSNATKVIAISNAIDHVMKQYDSKLPTTIIPSMKSRLACNSDTVRQLKNQFENKFVVGHVGALVKHHKGQQHIINIAQNLQETHPDILFVLVGNGKDEQALKQQAAGLKNVKFTGFVNNVGDYMSAFDMFIFPSLEEGLGSILLDAMDFSLPIIANAVDGIPDLVKHEENGLLVDAGNDEMLLNAVLTLYNDQTLRKKLGESGKSFSQEFLPENLSNKYISLYQSVLNS